MGMIVDAVLYKKMNPGDLWNIDRPAGAGPTGGGGQTYINLAIDDTELVSFLNYGRRTLKPSDHKSRDTITITASTLGAPTEISDITFDPRSNRNDYTIANQHRNRHPAWTSLRGFPNVPNNYTSSENVKTSGLTSTLVLLIIRTKEGEYIASFLNLPVMPPDWIQGIGLEKIFSGDTGILYFQTNLGLIGNSSVLETIESLGSNMNVLLYGPPGTGKTYVMQRIWEDIRNPVSDVVEVDVLNVGNPFILTKDPLGDFKGKIRTEWLTFHQNLGYEEFIVSKRPVSHDIGFSLEATAGVLLDVALSVDRVSGKYDKAIIFIDELNRGNVSKIFGQFITFLEADKRGWDQNGDINPMRIPVPLPELQLMGDETEKITLFDGTREAIAYPYFFPFPIYILASMNSVDRAVAPLDSALSRRFHKINFGPDYEYLAEILSIDESLINTKPYQTWTAKETAYKLLKRVNSYISGFIGEDFELGQSYIQSMESVLSEEKGFEKLSSIWERLILPQLLEKFGNRHDILIDLTKVEEGNNDSKLSPYYPYRYKKINGTTSDRLERNGIQKLALNSAQLSLLMRFLAYDSQE
ncbi:AAA family ATPase [Paenibacillus sp. CGMCC 1.18879]|uniref:AAA family ATPase n=2 Tax=Paenibacillus TaxID=44249 RepID=UPI001CA8499F|nr:AAA family ATPase [Paenibacillus sp. CGMCC 1.18879]MBY9078942.1 AAA family ATPase [Paenibacillus sp. CGMCC 1.18879]